MATARVTKSSVLVGFLAPPVPARVTRSTVLVGGFDLSPSVRVTRSSVLVGFYPVMTVKVAAAAVATSAPSTAVSVPDVHSVSPVGVAVTPPSPRVGNGQVLAPAPATCATTAPTPRGVAQGAAVPPGFTCDESSQDAVAAGMRRLLPSGLAWSQDPDSMLQRLLEGLSVELACLEGRGRSLLSESDPSLATELLPEWETSTGLPDACLQEQGTIPERRRDLVARLEERGAPSPAYLVEFAASLGFTVAIEELDPLVAGVSVAGDWLNNAGKPLRAGQAVAGDRLDNDETNLYAFLVHSEALPEAERERLECSMARLVPAQCVVAYIYPNLLQPVPALVNVRLPATTRG